MVVQQQPPPPPIAVAAPGQTILVTGPPTYVPPARTNVVVRERVVVQERVRYIQCFEGPYRVTHLVSQHPVDMKTKVPF